MLIKTKVDDVYEEGLNKEVNVASIYGQLGLDDESLDFILETLEKRDLISVKYPLLPIFNTTYISIRIPEKEEEQKPQGSVVEAYEIEGDNKHFWGIVNIIRLPDNSLFYYITTPRVKVSTLSLLEEIIEIVSSQIPPESVNLTEEEKSIKIYRRQCNITENILEKLVFNQRDKKLLCGMVRAKMFGLGRLEYLLHDPFLEEVVVNKARASVIVYHRKYGWMKTNLFFESESDVLENIARIGRRVGRHVSTLSPLLDAHLPGKERINATLFPISLSGNTITVRKFSEEPLTLPVLLNNKTLDYKTASLLWQALHYEMNVLVVGGTASGKTSMLNSLLMFIPPDQRIITIEDTREIQLPVYFENWVPLVSRPPNPEGLGAVTILDLMINSLRMRPDRIIVGEVRKAEEAQVMFEAMHTGHSVYSTFHANTAYVAIKRLSEDPINISLSELEIIDFIVTQRRDRRTNRRRTYEVAIMQRSEEDFSIDRIVSYRSRTDSFEFKKLPIEYINKVNFFTGMTEEEIYLDLNIRESILKWMVKQKLFRIDDVGKVVKLYYHDKERLLKGVENNLPLQKIVNW